MKKITSLFLAVLMLMLSTFSVAYAENTDGITFVVDDVEVNINDEQEIMLPISVENNTGFASVGFDVLYDSSCLTFDSLETVEAGTYAVVNSKEAGRLRIAFISVSNLVGDIAFLKLRFTVNEEAYDKDPSNVTIVLRDMADDSYVDVPVKTGDGNVASDSTVTTEKEEEILLGDVTLDGRINPSDAVAILKHLAGIETLTEKQLKAADTVAGGKINPSDAVAILKLCAGLITSF